MKVKYGWMGKQQRISTLILTPTTTTRTATFSYNNNNIRQKATRKSDNGSESLSDMTFFGWR